MLATDRAECRRLLEARRTELIAAIHARRGDIAVERTPDSADESQYAAEIFQAAGMINNRSRDLTAVQRALLLMGTGGYGVCEQCEREIPTKRMLARPMATYCCACQERVDAVDKGYREVMALEEVA
jgi:DnaK suppressor protein